MIGFAVNRPSSLISEMSRPVVESGSPRFSAATEQPFVGEYTDTETVGVYSCKACGNELFRSETKFHSGCGWPSFYAPTSADAVELIEDRSLAPRIRVEVRCANCGSHMGHVFEGEGYDVPTDQRWCINSVSLVLEPK